MPDFVIRFTVELLEDLHTGTGVGRLGIVDATQARDQAGRPVVWASTLRGLLREAGEDWLATLTLAGLPKETRVVREGLARLLGRTVGGLAAETSEAGSAAVRSLRLSGEVPNDPFCVWSSTARAAHSRRPLEKTLRQIEYARAGLTFQGEVRVPDQELVDLVRCLLARVPALGGGKTRGWGRVHLAWDGAPRATSAAPQPPMPPAECAGPVCLRLHLRNLEPLNLAATALAGNVIDGQSFLSGARLRGALLTWLPDHPFTEELAQPDRLSVGNAYVVPEDLTGALEGFQVLPAPHSLAVPKPGSEGTTSRREGPRILESGRVGDKLAQPGETGGHKRLKGEDCLARAGDTHWRWYVPRQGVLLRNTVPTKRRDPQAGRRERARADALFGEQVLWEDQHFVADLWFSRTEDARRFAQVAGDLIAGTPAEDRPWLRVGRGRRPIRVEGFAWCGPPPNGPPVAERLTLTCTSDLIARTPWLTFESDLAPATLIRLVRDAGGADLEKDLASLRKARAFAETTPVYGFNTASGLPRAAALAVKRGSVFRYEGTPEAVGRLRAALLGLQQRGLALGERTAEGHGRFLLDLDFHEEEYWKVPNEATVAPGPLSWDWREAVLERVVQFLPAVQGGNRKDRPSAAQWQWLRAQARSGAPLAGVFRELRQHATSLAAAFQWRDLPEQLQEATEKVGGIEPPPGRIPLETPEPAVMQRFFLDHLVQALVAAERGRRRAGGPDQ